MLRSVKATRTTMWIMGINLLILVTLLYVLNPLITLLLRNEQLFGLQPDILLHDTNKLVGSVQRAKVPRILHQTTATEVIPKKWQESQQSCLDVYHDFEYMLWTDDSAREFLVANYSWMVKYWDNYAFPIQRADAIRYFMMYHYGGIYLDMDTICKAQLPLDEIEADTQKHVAVFKPTRPTGVTNDILISSARHPAYEIAITTLPTFYKLTRFWATLQPYANIMMAAGPLFLTLAVKDYLMSLPYLPSLTVKIVNPSELDMYITDLESSTWHQADAHALMWLGERPWTWYVLGLVAFIPVITLIDIAVLKVWKRIVLSRGKSETEEVKVSKIA